MVVLIDPIIINIDGSAHCCRRCRCRRSSSSMSALQEVAADIAGAKIDF